MKMKKAILSCLMLMGVLSASAQEQKGTTEYVFEPHWYFQIQGGAQYTVGETKFGDLISPTVQGAIGYNFNKALGARLALNAWQSRGGWDQSDNAAVANAGLSKYKFTYFAPALDLTFNLSNIIAGINPNRKVDFGAFIGAGLNFRGKCDDAETNRNILANKFGSRCAEDLTYENKSAALLFGSIGLTADYRITDQVSIGLEVNANVLSDKYNFKKAGNADMYFNALLGLKYAFGPTYSTRFIPDPEPEIKYVEKIVEKIVEPPCPEPAVEPLRRDIFFLINKYNIRETEEQKVRDVVDYLRANQGAKVQVTGYADAGTGNDRINDRLAAQRADAVVKMLTDKYGIPADRISYDSKGARVQPFADNDSNRVTICIAE